MNEKLLECAKLLYEKAMEKPNKILEIFNNYFGKENVDMQGFPPMQDVECYLEGSLLSHYASITKIQNKIKDFEYECNYTLLNYVDAPYFDSLFSIIMEEPTIIFGDLYLNLFILVHFGSITISNEYNESTEIKDLWAKIPFTFKGRLYTCCFYLNRSTYTVDELNANYMHSHVDNIPFRNFEEFRSPCFGTGPIVRTMGSLNYNYKEELWELFCLELDKYVRTESVEGIPYHKLALIHTNRFNVIFSNYKCQFRYLTKSRDSDILSLLTEFTKYLIERKVLKFNYVNGNYSIGIPFIDFIVLISNEFITWYNSQNIPKNSPVRLQELISKNIIERGVISNNKLYLSDTISVQNSYIRYKKYIGKRVCKFKGEDILLNVSDINTLKIENLNIFLFPDIAFIILDNILKILNFTYNKNYDYDKYNLLFIQA